jgi:hypothetical protein
MSAPNLSITVEPFESGSVVYAPLAPNTANDQPNGMLSLVLRVTNQGNKLVHLKNVTLSYSAPPALGNASLPADVTIDAGQTKLWHFATADNQILPIPSPSKITLNLYCDGFTSPATFTNALGAYTCPAAGGGYLFPANVSDLRGAEYWQGRSSAHSPAGAGVQLFAYDLSVVAFTDGAWSELLPGGSSSKNEDYRIWGKPLYAMADGIVVDFANDHPTNPNPPADLSPPDPVEGNHFYLQHGNDLVLYAHMQPGSLTPQFLKKGAVVKAGDKLGLAGNSGNSSGPHLHIHAIKGTTPWQGPPRPLPFREINCIDRSVLNAPNPSGPWVSVSGQCLPAVTALIWPGPTLPIRFWLEKFYRVAIDPLALILSSEVYVKLTLPDPPPIDVFRQQVRDFVRAMRPEERQQAMIRLKALNTYFQAMEKELEQDW